MEREKALKQLAHQLIELKRNVKYIINHCSYTPADMDIGVAEITPWHTDEPPRGRGWRDIAYAIVVRRNGDIEFGRDLDNDGDVLNDIGAHTLGYNKYSIGICWVGGKVEDVVDYGDDNRTEAQKVTLLALMGLFKDHIKGVKILGHRDFAKGRHCPCFDAKTEYAILNY